MDLRRNVEIKARLADLAAAKSIASEHATAYLGVQIQTDTYFQSQAGRLKLREIHWQDCQPGTELPLPESVLIWYQRPDDLTAKTSQYYLVPITEPGALKTSLTGANGVRIVVAKSRAIYLWNNVRIHLDSVNDLGNFLEFEAVLPEDASESEGQQQVATLMQQFNISKSDLVPTSYVDLALSSQL